MHHKIPKSRRHKKLKSVDPDYTAKMRINKTEKLKFDQKPSDISVQEVPRKLQQLMRTTGQMKNQKFQPEPKKKKRKSRLLTIQGVKKTHEYGMVRPTKPVPENISQKSYETDNQFIKRVSRIADVAVQEAKFENKYGIEVGYEKSEATEKEDPRVLALLTDEKKPKKASRKNEKRKKFEEKKKLKSKQRIDDNVNEFSQLQDYVKFGEVVSEPPTLRVLSRKIDSLARKPGKSDLLLKNLLPGKQISNDKTVKRKYLPAAERRQLEIQREDAIDAYRKMKAEKASLRKT